MCGENLQNFHSEILKKFHTKVKLLAHSPFYCLVEVEIIDFL